MNKVILKDYGIDYDDGLLRCMNDVAFYERLLSMFLNDASFASAKSAKKSGDYGAMFASLHELKGVSGTSGLVELYNAVCPLVELVRDGSPDRKKLKVLFSDAEAAYKRAYKGISLSLKH